MLYPFYFTIDASIQADSYEEAKKIADDYIRDLDFPDNEFYPEVVSDSWDVGDFGVNDINPDE